ncbi:hypothetical protein KBD11_00410 [Candidatus Saccharibacteria bacterium]|nr:hypothetical protein [Candidatus Saccharibacteria bacterium]
MKPDERYQPPVASSFGWGGLPDVTMTPNADPVASNRDGSSYGTGTPLEVNDKGPGQQGALDHAPVSGTVVYNIGTANFYGNPGGAPAPSSAPAPAELKKIRDAVLALGGVILDTNQTALPRQHELTSGINTVKGKLLGENDPTRDSTHRRTGRPNWSKLGKSIAGLFLVGCSITGLHGYQDNFQESAGDSKVSAYAGTLSLLGSIGGLVGIGD